MGVRVGLIGLGSINIVHAMGYQAMGEKATIQAVCDTRTEVMEAKAKSWNATGYTDYHALIDDPDVDAVDITLPHNLHYEVARYALEHQKHVLVEKPMAPTVKECEELCRLAEARHLTFTVAENTRFVEAYDAVKDVLDRGDLGEIRLIRTFLYGSEVGRLNNPGLWKGRKDGTIGGVIMDAGPHTFYLLGWLHGRLQTVQASMEKLIEVSEVEDYALVHGRFADGALYAAEFTFTAEIPWSERLEVYGSKGTIVVDQLDDPPARLYRGAMDMAPAPLPGVTFDPMRWKLRSIMAGVQDFASAVAEGRPTKVRPEEGVEALRAIERAYASVAEAGAVLPIG